MKKKSYTAPAMERLALQVEGVVASSMRVHKDENLGGSGEFTQKKNQIWE